MLGKPLRVQIKRDLPPYEQGDRQHQKAPCVRLTDEEQRCEHHREVPVVDAACAAAFVLQEPGLERAEEHDAYHVTHRIRSAEQYHDAVVQYAHPLNTIQMSTTSIVALLSCTITSVSPVFT